MTGSAFIQPKASDHQEDKLVSNQFACSLQSFVRQLSAALGNMEAKASSDHEELLLETEFKGARYLLIRIPIVRDSRATLSPRELEIARMVAEGHPNKVIADVLNISAWTVSTHLRRIFAKLGVTSRAAMVARILPSVGKT